MAAKIAHVFLACGILLMAEVFGASTTVADPQVSPAQQGSPVTAPDKSVQVYVIRPPRFVAGIRAVSIELDGEQTGMLGNGGCLLLTGATPGSHLIVQSWPYWLGDNPGLRQKVTMRTEWVAGQTYYYEMVFPETRDNIFEWGLARVEPDVGASFVAAHRCKSV